MAKDFLPIPATSAASERSFSTGRDLIGINRHSLGSCTIESSITLRFWLRSKFVSFVEGLLRERGETESVASSSNQRKLNESGKDQ